MQKWLEKEDLERLIQKEDPSIRLMKLKKTPSSSKLWDLFHQRFQRDSLHEYISCDACKVLLKYRPVDGTCIMSTHVSACKECIQSCTSSPSPLTAYFVPTSSSTRRIPSHLKTAITIACSEFTAIDMRAFETMAGDGFINVIGTIFDTGPSLGTESAFDLKRLMPSPTTVREVDALSKIKNYLGYRLVGTLLELTNRERISWNSCVPGWTDTAWLSIFWTVDKTGIHYGGVALRHVNRNKRLDNYVLGRYPYDIDTNQSTPNIRPFVKQTLSEYGLNLNVNTYFMTGNEGKTKSAFAREHCKRIGCSEHYLSKQPEHSFISTTLDMENLNCQIAQEMFEKVKSIVTHVRRSHKPTKLSRKLQGYSETRLNDAFHMMNVLYDVYGDLRLVFNSNHLATYFEIDTEAFLLQRTSC